jgi:hypothetical protein
VVFQGYLRAAQAATALNQFQDALAHLDAAAARDPGSRLIAKQKTETLETARKYDAEHDVYSLGHWKEIFLRIPGPVVLGGWVVGFAVLVSSLPFCRHSASAGVCRGVLERQLPSGQTEGVVADGNRPRSKPALLFSCFCNDLFVVGDVNVDVFTEDAMVQLPMVNYADIEVPEPWKAFYSGLSSEDKVAWFDTTWDMCTDDERRLIVKDIQAFFGPADE